jgi:hypothetical protein
MQADACIVVEAGGRLIVDGARISGCRGGYWQGAEIMGNESLAQAPPSNQGDVRLKNDDKIEKTVQPALKRLMN